MAIQALFWQEEMPWMPENVVDFFEPEGIECTKRGVECWGGVWFLPNGRGSSNSSNPRYGFSLCLARPRFTNLESVTLDKVNSLTVRESSFEGGFITLTLM